jgi:hypothetical protein
VVVFRIEECRNNIGSRPTRNIEPPVDRKDFSYYAAKDIIMSREAQCGLMLWDAKSKGTLQNMLNLIGAGKRALVYHSEIIARPVWFRLRRVGVLPLVECSARFQIPMTGLMTTEFAD